MEDLVLRDGLFYERSSNTPFTGKLDDTRRKDPLSMENKRVHGLLTGKMDSFRPKAFISQANKLALGSIIMTTVTYGAKKVGERVNKTVCGLPTGITVN